MGFVGGDPVLLRPGAVTADFIETVLGQRLLRREDAHDRLTSPGQLASHYAPRAALRLNAHEWTSEEAVLAFGQIPREPAKAFVNISEGGDLIEAAANLFAALRTLDASGARSIAATPIPTSGLWRSDQRPAAKGRGSTRLTRVTSR